MNPWTDSINARASDGYIALIDERGVRVVADGFEGTNEVRMDAREEWLYVVESNGRRISRLRVQPDGSLTESGGVRTQQAGRAFRTALPSMPSAISGSRW